MIDAKEIVQALRCCQFGEPCDRCPVVRDQNCVNVMHKCAADLIERLSGEVEDLRRKLVMSDKDGRVLILEKESTDGTTYKPE